VGGDDDIVCTDHSHFTFKRKYNQGKINGSARIIQGSSSKATSVFILLMWNVFAMCFFGVSFCKSFCGDNLIET